MAFHLSSLERGGLVSLVMKFTCVMARAAMNCGITSWRLASQWDYPQATLQQYEG